MESESLTEKVNSGTYRDANYLAKTALGRGKKLFENQLKFQLLRVISEGWRDEFV